MSKVYLGDAVYAEFTDGMLKLTTEYGSGPTNTVYLEPEVFVAMVRYVREAGIASIPGGTVFAPAVTKEDP